MGTQVSRGEVYTAIVPQGGPGGGWGGAQGRGGGGHSSMKCRMVMSENVPIMKVKKIPIYYQTEVRRGKYWGLGVFLLQYFPQYMKILHYNCTDMG